MAMTLEELYSEKLRQDCLSIINKIGKKLNSRTTKRELKEFISKGFESRLEKNKKIRIKNSQQCKEWKDREKSGENKGSRRRSCYLG